MSESFSSSESSPFSRETRAEIARLFGEPMAEVVANAVARSLREVAAEAKAAGLPPETAVAGFLHACREFCEAIERGRKDGDDGRGEAGLN